MGGGIVSVVRSEDGPSLLEVLVALLLSGWFSVTGVVKFVRNQYGEWQAAELTIPSEGITPSEVKGLVDFLNEK